MKILIIGSGGREHALAWKTAQSPAVKEVWVAPGNGGTASEPKVKNINIAVTDIPALTRFAHDQQIDLTIVGPEIALAAGVVDAFAAQKLPCFGPTREAAQLESSKVFAKQWMQRCQIPTAPFASFDNLPQAMAYLETQSFPVVIKADGLAAGKGVIIAQDFAEASTTLHDIFTLHRFGDAGLKVLIEAFLTGTELSFIVVTDGQTIVPLASSQDHKRRDDHDLGPNTGGMGAFSPARQITPLLETRVIHDIVRPLLKGLAAQGIHYCGFLYVGLMISPAGDPFVLEFNCRLGDPETEPLMMRLQSDLVELCLATLHGTLKTQQLRWDPRPALGVVMAAEGYPEPYRRHDRIIGLEPFVENSPDVHVFHCGTQRDNGDIFTQGGRVLCVTALGENVTKAREHAYARCKSIFWPGAFYRHDIGA